MTPGARGLTDGLTEGAFGAGCFTFAMSVNTGQLWETGLRASGSSPDTFRGTRPQTTRRGVFPATGTRDWSVVYGIAISAFCFEPEESESLPCPLRRREQHGGRTRGTPLPLPPRPYLEVGAGDTLGQLPEERLHDLDELRRLDHVQDLLQLVQEHHFLRAVSLRPVLEKRRHHLQKQRRGVTPTAPTRPPPGDGRRGRFRPRRRSRAWVHWPVGCCIIRGIGLILPTLESQSSFTGPARSD